MIILIIGEVLRQPLIKPENRGKFTKWCGGKVTQECIEKGCKDPDPKIRAQARFAKSVRKWKHPKKADNA